MVGYNLLSYMNLKKFGLWDFANRGNLCELHHMIVTLYISVDNSGSRKVHTSVGKVKPLLGKVISYCQPFYRGAQIRALFVFARSKKKCRILIG